jgi:hypothetical protein
MASIYKELAIEVSPAQAWAALRRVGDAHRLFAPVLVHAQLDDDVRTVRFANGMVLQERILDVDDERRRVAYTALNGPGMTYHHASMQVVDAGSQRCLFVWITDFLPREMSDNLTPLIEQGTRALKGNLERVDPKRNTE